VTGKPLTWGGVTSGGKRAINKDNNSGGGHGGGADAGAYDGGYGGEEAPAAFLEFASSAASSASSSSEEATEEEFATLLEMHAELEAYLSHQAEIGANSPGYRRARRQENARNLRHVNPTTYPRNLNDYGFDENYRNRKSDTLLFKPRVARMSKHERQAQQQKWDAVHAQYKHLYSTVYSRFESLCARRIPLAYSGYCDEMMQDYRYIAQGIQYGDRAQSICMNGNWCSRKSYIRNAVHAFFVRENGDSPVYKQQGV